MQPIKIRMIREDDASAYIDLLKAIDSETVFMLFEASERNLSADQLRSYIQTLKGNTRSAIFIATDNDQLIGYLTLQGSALKKISHRSSLVMGVKSCFSRQGVGTLLLNKADEWIRSNKVISRLELTVISSNTQAFNLYKKCGFIEEGRRTQAIILNGRLMDEIYMAKLYWPLAKI